MTTDAATTPDAAAPRPAAPTRRRLLTFAAFVWLAIMVVTFRPSADVIGDLLVPDGAEYVTAAQRLATVGRYDIVIDGKAWPSRYPPGWASLIAPAYWVDPTNLAAGVWISRALWAAGCAALAASLGARLGFGCALLVVAAINAEPYTRDLAATPLADAPAVAVMLALLAIRAAGPVVTLRRAAAVGLLLALGVACRPLSIAFALPFLIDAIAGRRRLLRLAALLAPAGAVALATLVYNRATFGSASLNGYVFWCPMPYARLDYVFNLGYLPAMLRSIAVDRWLSVALAGGVIGATWIASREPSLRRAYLLPLILLAVPLTAVHCCYFFFQQRLFLPGIVAGAATFALAVASRLTRSEGGRGLAGAVGVALLTLALVKGLHRATAEVAIAKSQLLTDMAAELPDDCNVVTFGDPVTFEAIVNRGGGRRWIAASREQEYADKAYVPGPIDLTGISRPPPTQHRSPALFARGARDVVPATADEDAVLDRLAASDIPTFVDRLTLLRVEPLEARLRERFDLSLVPNTRDLFRCTPRSTATRPAP